MEMLKKVSVKKLAVGGALAALVALGGVVTPATAAPAQAANCQSSADWGGFPGNTGRWVQAYSNDCYRVQARVLRYISGSITTYLGPQAANSYTEGFNGTPAGQGYRTQAATGDPWTVWGALG